MQYVLLILAISAYGFAEPNTACSATVQCKKSQASCSEYAYADGVNGVCGNPDSAGKFLMCESKRGIPRVKSTQYICCLPSGAAFVTRSLDDANKMCETN